MPYLAHDMKVIRAMRTHATTQVDRVHVPCGKRVADNGNESILTFNFPLTGLPDGSGPADVLTRLDSLATEQALLPVEKRTILTVAKPAAKQGDEISVKTRYTYTPAAMAALLREIYPNVKTDAERIAAMPVVEPSAVPSVPGSKVKGKQTA